jgi:hypothetical protein
MHVLAILLVCLAFVACVKADPIGPGYSGPPCIRLVTHNETTDVPYRYRLVVDSIVRCGR